MEVLGLEPGSTAFEYTGGDRGWKGDVPVVRIATGKIRSLGWANERTGPGGAARLDDRRWPTRPARGCSPRDRDGRAVFLDRDGVLNRAFVDDGVPVPPRTRGRLRAAARAWSRRARPSRTPGWRWSWSPTSPTWPAARWTRPSSRPCTTRLRAELPLDDVVVCPHDGKEGCWCRKPRPGMILDAARRLGLDLDRSVAVGDRWRDIDAAHRAGVAVGLDRLGARRTAPGLAGRTFWLSRSRHGIMSCRCAGSRPTAREPRTGTPPTWRHRREDLRRRRRPREHHRPRRGPPDLRASPPTPR